MIGTKVRLSNGKFAKVIKQLSSTALLIHYKGDEGESTRVISIDEWFNGSIELCLFGKSLSTANNSNYLPVKRDTEGRPK